MGWARLDDEFHDSPASCQLTLPAVGLFTICLSWAHYWRLTNPTGHIPLVRAKMSAPRIWRRLAAELVAAGLWTEGDRGWYIVDFDSYIGGSGDVDKTLHAAIRGRDRRQFRDIVFQRDGYRCVNCGSTDDLTLDHIIPLAHSTASRTVDEFATLCRSCNSRKGARV